MGEPVVHFEVIGADPEKLRSYYGDLFGWEFDTSAPVSDAVSEPDNYGFTDGNTTEAGVGIPGGVGGGPAYTARANFTTSRSRRQGRHFRKARGLGGPAVWVRPGPRRASWSGTSPTRKET